MHWPALREELDLLPGPTLPDGQPSWTLHDPVRNLFFRIDWPTFEVLQRWGGAEPQQVAHDITQHTTLHLDADDVLAVAEFAQRNQLCRPEGPDSAQRMAAHWQARQGTWWHWLLHHYLFFRIPLWRPDAWLTRWQHVAAWFTSRPFLWASAVACVLGLWQVVRQWDGFRTALVDTFNWSGLAAYGTAIAAVKVLHELGHAFTAKHQGCKVPTMGVAFLVMWPVAYTDTNDAWRLTQRMARLKVACAGIATELMVAVWATCAWGLLPDGALRSAAFVLATSSWIATLAVNASPFMRFDGYFIVSDALDMPNLHERSFALAQWRLREILFDLGEPPPEHLSPARTRALIAFAWVTWLYRLVLFLGIAALVYHFFIKLVGLLLFAVEIVWFVAKPIWQELRVWHAYRNTIRQRPRSRRTLWVSLALFGALLVPWPTRISASAMLRPVDTWPVFAPAGAQIEALPHANGETVQAGQTLVQLHLPDLAMRRQAALAKLDKLQWHASASAFDTEARANLLVNEDLRTSAQSELAALDAEQALLQPAAPYSGHLVDMDPDLRVGQWVSRKDRLAVLIKADSAWQIETWLEEDAVAHIRVGDAARFIWPGAPWHAVHATVHSVESDATRILPRPELAVQHGGHILTRDKDNRLMPEHAVYRVVLTVSPQDVPQAAWSQHTWRGQLTLHGDWEAPAWPYLRQAAAVLIREWGF